MGANQSQRPTFYENQYLGAADLNAIIDYSRFQEARHVLGAHTWGIVIGLQLAEKASSGGGNQVNMYLQPGYAWDGFGRPIVVLAPYQLPAQAFQSIPYNAAIDGGSPEGHLVPVWLRYDQSETQPPSAGFAACDAAGQFARIQESFQIEVGNRPNPSDQRDSIVVNGRSVDAAQAPKAVDANDTTMIYDASIPYQTFPDDDTQARWLIPLGFVRWKPNPNPNQPGYFVARSAGDLKQSKLARHSIGVVAEGIQAADGIIRMRSRTSDDSSAAWSDDLVWVEGKLRVEDDARLFGSKLDFRDSLGQQNNVPLTLQRLEDNGQGGTDLQVGIGQAAIGQPPQGKNRFAIGPLDITTTSPKITEQFIVRDDGKVGIGTTTPREPLGIRATGTNQELLGFEDPSGTTRWHINQNFGGNSGLNFVETGVADGRLFIQAGGNVGIGTTQPTAQLDVRGQASVQGPLSINHAGVTGVGSPGDTRAAITFGATDTPAAFFLGAYDGTTAKANTTLGLYSYQFGDWLQFWSPNGRVGIGTVTPARKLHVEGSEIHSGNAGAGFSFGNRETTSFVEGPTAGERWVWYSSVGTARLWSGNDKLSITPAGSLDMAGNITVRGNRTYLLGLDGAQTHWIMAGGTQEGVNNAIGLTIGTLNNTFHTGPGWVKGFLIHHPLQKEEKYLSHATLEGPEAAVFYRGEAALSDGMAIVVLPDYFEALTRKEERTVQLTSKLEGDAPVSIVAASEVTDGRFTVRAVGDKNQTQKFYWEVKAVRADVGPLRVEQMKAAIG